jgi:tripartite-type tricarboxylate transporter receptor subunit TctC
MQQGSIMSFSGKVFNTAKIPPAGLILLVCTSISGAADWPLRPVRIVLATSPGGGTDIVTRMVGAKLSDSLKQQFIIDSKPGAGGGIADEFVAKSTADGYTLLFQSQSISVTPNLSKPLYDALTDFQPMAKLISQAFVIVSTPKLPVKNLREVVSYSMTQPNGLNAAVPGAATHLTGVLFKLVTNARLTLVPYKGGAPGSFAVMSGETDIGFMDIPSVASHINSGKITALAVTTARRVRLLPNVPTAAEAGMPEIEVEGWLGSFTPAKTPSDIVNRLNTEINTALRAPDVGEKIYQIGGEPAQTTVAEFTKFYRGEIAKWKDVVTRAKVKLD